MSVKPARLKKLKGDRVRFFICAFRSDRDVKALRALEACSIDTEIRSL